MSTIQGLWKVSCSESSGLAQRAATPRIVAQSESEMPGSRSDKLQNTTRESCSLVVSSAIATNPEVSLGFKFLVGVQLSTPEHMRSHGMPMKSANNRIMLGQHQLPSSTHYACVRKYMSAGSYVTVGTCQSTSALPIGSQV